MLVCWFLMLMWLMIIDDDFDHSLSSLKKNRKATFDVSYRGVLYSAFFVSLYVSMMESMIALGGVRFESPRIDHRVYVLWCVF